MTNNSGSVNYLFTGNGSFTYEFEDGHGNTGSVTATVTWIDKDAPYATSVVYNPSTPTSGNVVVTLTINEAVQAISGRTGGPTVRTKTYTTNTTETITFYDLVGNQGQT